MYIAHNCIWEKKTLKFRVMICIGEGRMGGWVIFFFNVWGHCLPWALIGLHSYVGACPVSFVFSLHCVMWSWQYPKGKAPLQKRTRKKKKEQKTNVHCAAPDSLWPVCFSKWEIIYVDFLLTFNLYSMIQANKRSTQDIT